MSQLIVKPWGWIRYDIEESELGELVQSSLRSHIKFKVVMIWFEVGSVGEDMVNKPSSSVEDDVICKGLKNQSVSFS